MERGLHIAHILLQVLLENEFSRLVVALWSGEPLHGMLDQVGLKVLESRPFEVSLPAGLWLNEFFRVETLKEFVCAGKYIQLFEKILNLFDQGDFETRWQAIGLGQGPFNVQMGLGFGKSMDKALKILFRHRSTQALSNAGTKQI